MDYDIDNSYLYEILDDYQCSGEEEQVDIFTAFVNKIWASPNKRRISTKYYSYKVFPTINDTEIINVFNKYSKIPYLDYRSRCSGDSYIDMIRQRINNLYTIYCDDTICVSSKYHELLRKPKDMYYEYLLSSNFLYTATELDNFLSYSINQAHDFFENSKKEKIHISWRDYKALVSKWLWRIFNNYDESKASIYKYQMYDFVYGTEDLRIVQYINRSLSGYMKNYQKQYYGITRKSNGKYSRCECGNLFLQNKQNNRRLCDECRRKSIITKNAKYNKKRFCTEKDVTTQLNA